MIAIFVTDTFIENNLGIKIRICLVFILGLRISEEKKAPYTACSYMSHLTPESRKST